MAAEGEGQKNLKQEMGKKRRERKEEKLGKAGGIASWLLGIDRRLCWPLITIYSNSSLSGPQCAET